jgi:hypothetical protein
VTGVEHGSFEKLTGSLVRGAQRFNFLSQLLITSTGLGEESRMFDRFSADDAQKDAVDLVPSVRHSATSYADHESAPYRTERRAFVYLATQFSVIKATTLLRRHAARSCHT